MVKMPMLTILDIKVQNIPDTAELVREIHVNYYDILVNIFCYVNIFVVKFSRLLLVDFHFNADRNFHTKTTTIKVSIDSKYADLYIYKYDLDNLLN